MFCSEVEPISRECLQYSGVATDFTSSHPTDDLQNRAAFPLWSFWFPVIANFVLTDSDYFGFSCTICETPPTEPFNSQKRLTCNFSL